MNTFLQLQCRNMISTIRVFLQACELAARKDDGRISIEEQKALKVIRASAEAFIKELRTFSTDSL